MGGLITTLILLISSGIVIYNAIRRIISPSPINYNGMFIFAIIGLIVNLIATIITHGGNSINQKAVNLHMLEDVLGWLVVLIGAIIIKLTNLYVIDPILSILVAIFIIFNSFKYLIEILKIFVIKTPKNIDLNKIIEEVKRVEGVKDVHHLHVWTIDGEINCATLHLVVNQLDSSVKSKVKEELNKQNVSHTTIEMETIDENCKERTCNVKQCNNFNHHHHH